MLLRDRENRPQPVFSREIDPADMFIVREAPAADVRVIEQVKNGPPATKVDLVIIGEGYTEAIGKIPRGPGPLQRLPPRGRALQELGDRFNITGLFKPSAESGCDEPGYGSFKNTALGAQFDSFGSERYMLTDDNRAWRDVAAACPLRRRPDHGQPRRATAAAASTTSTAPSPATTSGSNTSACTSSATPSRGLADEYYTSAVAYNEFYPAGVEPLEANITALLDAEEHQVEGAGDQKNRRAHALGRSRPTRPWKRPTRKSAGR